VTATPSNPSRTSADVDDCARRLDALVQRSTAFAQAQLARVEDFAACNSPVQAVDEQNEEAEWRRERAAWQQERAVQEARIDEQLDHLTKAWRDLEIEQRRLLIQGRTMPEQAPDRPESPASETLQSDHSLDLVEEAGAQGVGSAAFQFQRLKREIRQQRQRER
jgi:hypothetical protein